MSVSTAESPLLNGAVHRFVDYKGLPTVRSKSGCWKSAGFIICVELAERLTYYGLSSNLVTFLTGPLGLSTATAAANVNAWSGTGSLLPILGAFVADSFLGRYWVIIISSLLHILGLGFLSLSATIINCGNNTICSPSQLQTIFFFVSLYLVAFAQGGLKPCLLAFGADQFDDEDQKERTAKSSFFNWWYFFMCASLVFGILGLNYIQDNLSWELSFGISSIVMCLALILFFLGKRTYRFSTSTDEMNPLIRIGRVFITSARSPQSSPTAKPIESVETQLPLTRKGPQIKEEGEVSSPSDVEDAKAILRLVPIWLTCLVYGIAFSQTSTLFTKQGATMDRHITSAFQIPAASLLSIISITIVISIPIYDRVFVPIARSITGKPSGISMLQRVGTGVFLSFLSMLAAALVERKRLVMAAEYGLVDKPKTTVPMSIWWLSPQYVLFGMADVFTMIGLQELFYEQFARDLKSVGLALCLSIIGVGGFLSSFLISVIGSGTSGNGNGGWFSDNLNRAHLDYFYLLLAGLSAFELAMFVYFAKCYTYRGRIITT